MERLAPLEERIRDELVNWIKQGQVGLEGQLPSEAELAKNFGVSRATVRAALSLLAAQGIIIRKHGSGTYVNHAMLRLRLEVSEKWEFQDLIRSSGFKPGIHFLDAKIIPAEKEEATALRIKLGDPILNVRKIFTADGKPAIYSINMLSLSLAYPPHDQQKLQGPIFPYLAEAYNQTPAYSVTDLSPVVATAELAQLLQVEELSPLLLFKDIFFNADNQPIMYAHNYFTDILHFKAIRQPYGSWI